MTSSQGSPRVDIATEYDQRGLRALAANDDSFGSARIPSYLAEPYQNFEELLERTYRASDKTREPRLLDLCCGTGVHAIFAAKLGYRVVCIDISPKSIEAARSLAARTGVSSRCEFVVGDVRQQLEALGTFDVVICVDSLYYFDIACIMEQIDACLSPGGWFFSIETNGDNRFMNLYRRLKAFIFNHRDQRTLTDLMGKPALTTVDRQIRIERLRYYDCATMAGVVLSRLPFVAKTFHAAARRFDAFWLNDLGFGRRLGFKFLIAARKSS